MDLKTTSCVYWVLNQVCTFRKTGKIFLHSLDVIGRVAGSFSNTDRFGYISLLHFFSDDAIIFGRNFSPHSSNLRSMSTTSWLGRSFPYISMIYWYTSLSSGTLVITVGIKNKNLEAECENLVNLNSSSLTDLSMEGISNTCTTQKMKFSIKDFSSKCDQIRSVLRIWSHLLKKTLMENFIFYSVLSVICFRAISFSIVSIDLFVFAMRCMEGCASTFAATCSACSKSH